MKHFLRGLSLRGKLLLGDILLLMILLVPSVFFYLQSMDKTLENNTAYMNQINSQANLNVNLLFSSLDRLNFLHYTDGEMRRILFSDNAEKSAVDSYEDEKYLRNALNHAFRNDTFVVRGGIVNEYGDVYCSVVGDMTAYRTYVEELTKGCVWDDHYRVYYLGPHEANVQLSSRTLVTMVQRLYYYESYVGTICVDLNFDKIVSQFNDAHEPDFVSSLCVLDGDVLLYNSALSDLKLEDLSQEGTFAALRETANAVLLDGKQRQVELCGEKYLVTAAHNAKTGWILVQYAPMTALDQLSFQAIRSMLALFAGTVLVAVVLSIFLSRQIIKPLQSMINSMEFTGEGYLEPIDISPESKKTEMGALMQNFNSMVRRINKGIDVTYRYELDNKRMELKMLQYQINPHFLYNTLNTIGALAEIRNVPEIAKITGNLAAILHYNLGEGNVVALSDEIAYARSYFQIQEIRFPGRFHTGVVIAPEVKESYMLKFLIQPVIENSFSHGLGDKRTNACVQINACRVGEDLLISVFDNGVGMSEADCAEWNRRLREDGNREGDDKSIGLINVNTRIRSFYGPQYGLEIESVPGKFTKVTLRLKFMRSQEALRENHGQAGTGGENP